MAPRFPVDLEDNKSLFVDYAKTQTDFTDYNFEGSNLSQINNLFGYKTQQMSFYMNMILNELFMDDAKLESNILKIARLLNYMPRRNVAPYLIDQFTRTSAVTTIIPKYTKFKIGDIAVTNIEDILLDTDDPTNIRLYEGEIITEIFIPTGDGFEEFILANKQTIDNNIFTVYVDTLEDDGNFTPYEFLNANESDFDVDGRNFYFKYLDVVSIRFDNGELFVKPKLGDNIRVIYLKTNGTLYSGSAGTLEYNDTNTIIKDSFTIANNSPILNNGLDAESNTAIKLRAPLFYITQGRAVTEPDYNILIQNYSKYDAFADAIVWSGTKEFIGFDGNLSLDSLLLDLGHAEIAVLNDDYSYIDSFEIADITAYFLKKKPMMIFPRFITPSFLKIQADTNIKFISEINIDISETEETINTYLKTLEGFNKEYKRSNIITFIDNLAEIDYLTYSTTFVFSYNITEPGFFRVFNEIVPGSFSYIDAIFTLYDDGAGLLKFNLTGDSAITVGTIDYDTGVINITGNLTGAYGQHDIPLEFVNSDKLQTERECFMFYENITNTILR